MLFLILEISIFAMIKEDAQMLKIGFLLLVCYPLTFSTSFIFMFFK